MGGSSFLDDDCSIYDEGLDYLRGISLLDVSLMGPSPVRRDVAPFFVSPALVPPRRAPAVAADSACAPSAAAIAGPGTLSVTGTNIASAGALLGGPPAASHHSSLTTAMRALPFHGAQPHAHTRPTGHHMAAMRVPLSSTALAPNAIAVPSVLVSTDSPVHNAAVHVFSPLHLSMSPLALSFASPPAASRTTRAPVPAGSFAALVMPPLAAAAQPSAAPGARGAAHAASMGVLAASTPARPDRAHATQADFLAVASTPRLHEFLADMHGLGMTPLRGAGLGGTGLTPARLGGAGLSPSQVFGAPDGLAAPSPASGLGTAVARILTSDACAGVPPVHAAPAAATRAHGGRSAPSHRRSSSLHVSAAPAAPCGAPVVVAQAARRGGQRTPLRQLDYAAMAGLARARSGAPLPLAAKPADGSATLYDSGIAMSPMPKSLLATPFRSPGLGFGADDALAPAMQDWGFSPGRPTTTPNHNAWMY